MGLGTERQLLKENLGLAAVYESLWSVWHLARHSQRPLWPEYENARLSDPAFLWHPSPGTLVKEGTKLGEHTFLNKILKM